MVEITRDYVQRMHKCAAFIDPPGAEKDVRDLAASWLTLEAESTQLRTERDAALRVKRILFEMLQRRSRRESELRIREVEPTKVLADKWTGMVAVYGKSPTGSAMRAVVDAADALIRAEWRNQAALQQVVVDLRAIHGEIEQHAALSAERAMGGTP